ncbi:unnamed protein product [Miscanthus lutarioriparius]|uniref:DUF4220 domain-containing protein n=1 Tax=Miscanthus lutarioriparius TaxID=422564 RepID=A0A811RG73_9POAL|nr:unnamed protein product [Miscanthus lutarioriparius]
MVDILRAVQWWDEWQLRILVIGSLGLQWFLLLAAPLRNYTIPRLFTCSIWAAYVSADALAIYALATLFNRHSKATSSISSCSCCDYGNKGSSLEVLWAPLLLVYLGGREEITAYTIEDNELWTRHTVTMVSQVTVAVYSFYKSWPDSSDRKLLLSAILLFVIGIISFIEKPWALRRASIKRLVAMWSVMKGERESPTGWDWCFTELSDRYKCWKKLPEGDAPILSQSDQVQMIMSDLSLFAAEVTLQARRKMSGGDREKTILEPLDVDKDVRLKRMLRQAFGLIYTRANVIFTPAYLACHVMLVPSLYIAAIMLFAASRKRGYGATDVKITYILLCFTAVLDVFGLLISDLMYKLMSGTKLAALCENIPGLNLVDSVLRTARRPVAGSLLNCARRFGYYLKEAEAGTDHTSNLYRPVSDAITLQLVRVFKKKNVDLSSYRSFTKTDYWTKDQMDRLLNTDVSSGTGKTNVQNVVIRRSLHDTPFDASVLIWHIATDLCFRSNPPRHFRCRPLHSEVLREVCTEAISNYMAYLLVFRPDMLMTGSRQYLFTEATKQMQRIITQATKFTTDKEKQQKQPLSDDILLGKIRKEAVSLKDNEAYTIIDDACKLAEELLRMEDPDDRWYLMHRVWVGMLCYSASMCRGYLHAKSLGEGGEFLSYVWLLISLQGAKTLADKLQMPDKEQGDDDLDDQKREQEYQGKKGTMPGWDPEARMFHRQPY